MPSCPPGSRARGSSAGSVSSPGSPARSRRRSPAARRRSSSRAAAGSARAGSSTRPSGGSPSLPEPFLVVRCRARPGRIGDPFGAVALGLERLVAGLSDADLVRGCQHRRRGAGEAPAGDGRPSRPARAAPGPADRHRPGDAPHPDARVDPRAPAGDRRAGARRARPGGSPVRRRGHPIAGHVPRPRLAARSAVRAGHLPARPADPEPPAPRGAGGDGRGHVATARPAPLSRSIATSSSSSSRASRASVHRRRCSCSWPSDRAAMRSSRRRSWPLGASSPGRPSPGRSTSWRWPASPSGRRSAGGSCGSWHRPASRSGSTSWPRPRRPSSGTPTDPRHALERGAAPGGGILDPDLAVGLVEALAHGFVALDRPTADADRATSTTADSAEITPERRRGPAGRRSRRVPARAHRPGSRGGPPPRPTPPSPFGPRGRAGQATRVAGPPPPPGPRARPGPDGGDRGGGCRGGHRLPGRRARPPRARAGAGRPIDPQGRPSRRQRACAALRQGGRGRVRGRSPDPGCRLRRVGDRPARRAHRPGRRRAPPRAARALSTRLRRH